MNLLSPGFLWAFAALLPLAAIYFLKVRPRRQTTTAYFLWAKIFTEKKAASLFNRLRDLISLLLMLLAFSAVVMGLAQPEFSGDERKDLILLIDHSASMSAKEGINSTRFDQALESARGILIGLNGNQRAAVASAGREIHFRSHLSNSPRELLTALKTIGPSDFPFDPAALTSFGAQIPGGENKKADYRIILLSDGHFTGADKLPESIELMKIGAPADNAGIVTADLQRLPDGSLQFYCRVASSFKKQVEADLVLENEGRIYKLIPLKITPGENAPEIFSVEEAPAGKWVARIEIEDALAKDNTAWLAVPERRPVRVQVAAADRYFFETSVRAFESSSGLLQLVDKDPEITLAKGSATGGNELSLIFSPAGESPWWTKVGEEVEAVAPRVLLENHPALRHLDLASIAFIGARQIEPPIGALVLVESETGVPLIYRVNREGKTALVVNMDPLASEFYYSAFFPVLIHGAATHLAGREEELAAVYRPGDTAPIPGFREGNSAAILTPGGATESTQLATIGPLPNLGFYQIENPRGTWPVAASLVTPAESLLDNSKIASTAKPVSSGQAPAYWLVVLALLLLTGESILYHQRKAG